MTSPDASARPAQVTVAGWAVAVASVFLVVSVFSSLADLHSIDVRDQLAERIRSGNLKGLGISVTEALSIKRWALYVSGVAAVVTGILGVFVLQKDKVARIVLSVAAVPIVLATPFTETFLAVLVGAGAAVLWSRPARDWFAGRPITQREPRPPARPDPRPFEQSGPPHPPAPWIPPQAGNGPTQPAQPSPMVGWGSPPGSSIALEDLPPPSLPMAAYPHPVAQTLRVPRPSQVRIACLLTWVFTTVTALGLLVVLAAVTVDQQPLIDEVKKNAAWDPSNDDQLIVTATVVGVIACLLWCAAAAVVAVFAWRGQRWAWVVLLIFTILAGVAAIRILPYSLLHLAAIGATLGMLLSSPSRSWFRSPPR